MTAAPRELPSGKWQGIALHPSGRRSTRTFALKRQAAKWAADTEAEWRRSGFRDPRAGQVTVSAWHERWWAARIAGRPTMARDEQVWRLHVGPQWGDWPLEAITRMDVQGWAARQLAAGTGLRTVQQSVGLLSMLMQSALDEDPPILAGRNPCRGVAAALPDAPQRPPVYYTVEQVDAILCSLSDPYRTLFDFAFWTGLRWGELAGLQARHVDLLHGLIHVQDVLERDGTLRQGDPKSETSRREVPLPEHLAGRVRELAAVGGHVFRRPDGEPLEYYRARVVWRNAVAAARTCTPDAPCRRGGRCLDAAHHVPAYGLHATRHTYASWLVMQGVDLYRVQSLLGHESHVTTRRYAHLAPHAHDVAREALRGLRARAAHAPSARVARNGAGEA
jgi:integrase